jgi:transcriptional regulator with XRE-family HTH domain
MQAEEPDPDGAFVHRLRVERGITQEALAIKAHVTIATLSRIERGVTAPKVGTLRKIATALGMSLAELVTAVEQQQH